MVARWVPFAGAGAGVVIVGVIAAVVLVPQNPEQVPREPDAPSLTFAEQAPAPQLAVEPTGPGLIGLVDADWVSRTAATTGIPREAVLAYGAAALSAADTSPECGIGWNTLAGIGYAESDHGRHGGATFEENGHVSPKIFGVPLDGTSTAHIPDTDDGEFDETADIDRAIGPMQIIPQTWRSWPSDANGDLVPDPHNIYDAALAAANYLCNATTDFRTPEGWSAGIAAYNADSTYTTTVATAAQSYLDITRG